MSQRLSNKNLKKRIIKESHNFIKILKNKYEKEIRLNYVKIFESL